MPQPTESLAASFGASATNSVYLRGPMPKQYRTPPVSPQYLRAWQPTALVARLFPHLQLRPSEVTGDRPEIVPERSAESVLLGLRRRLHRAAPLARRAA